MSSVIALFRGPAHILADGNEEDRAVVPEWAWGMPVREAFPQPEYAELQAIMDAVYADGETRALPVFAGVVTVVRLEDHRGHPLGVGTHFASRSPISQLPPADQPASLPAASHLQDR